MTMDDKRFTRHYRLRSAPALAPVAAPIAAPVAQAALAARRPNPLGKLLSACPGKLDRIGLALTVAVWGAALFLLGVLAAAVTLDQVDVAGIMQPPTPAPRVERAPSYAPLVHVRVAPLAPGTATPPAGGALPVLPAQGAPTQ